ncbi:hypothetical protein [Paraburkholderia sp. BR14374]|uniref:hypothetical protein n=1 Tax=Paraburkholderia sp. BR14374 TaxID=3237007 RepID=UPI0034CFFF42
MADISGASWALHSSLSVTPLGMCTVNRDEASIATTLLALSDARAYRLARNDHLLITDLDDWNEC